MNRTIKNTFSAFTALAIVSFGLGAHAAEPARVNYENELERCIAELRLKLNTAGASQVRHRVVRVEQQGAYYVFDLETDRMNGQQQPITSPVESRCTAHRWQSSAVVVMGESEEAGARLAQSQ